MKKCIERIMAVCVCIPAFALASAVVPSVSNVSMSQAADRTVTITYTLANAPAVVTLDIQTNVTGDVWESIGGENISGVLEGVPGGDVWKVVEGDGQHSITWRPYLSWPENRVPSGGARAVVTAWATNAAPDYMVVDLSANSSQRVSYYPGEKFLPGGLLSNPDYRTTRLVMRKIPAEGAVFTMGSVSEAGRNANNEETHSATLSNNYYIGVFQITQTQWTKIMGSNPSAFTTEGMMRPVECVSFVMIRENIALSGAYDYQFLPTPYSTSFLGKLRTLVANTIDFDIPGEAEWEYACRAGNGEGYWGDGVRIEVDKYVPGRYRMNQEDTDIAMNVETPPTTASTLTTSNATAICGSYQPNKWGLYDMHGNVQEWCLDFYKADITGLNGALNTTPATMSGSDGRRHVLRGGSWNDKSGGVRSAYRFNAIKTKALAHLGVRVKCTTGAK